MEKSAVAGIIDKFGGLRVVVTQEHRFKHHINPARDELLIVVPGFYEPEPIPYHRWAPVVRTVELYVAEWVRTRNDPDTREHPAVIAYRCRHTARPLTALHLGDNAP